MRLDGDAEETLDPEDWDEIRSLGHRMVDDMLGWLESARDRKVWQPVPEEVKAFFDQPLPEIGQQPDSIYEDFQNYILPYPMGNTHPRFWSWVMGNGTALGMLAEMLAAGMNPNMGGGEHAGIYVERQVIDWTRAMLGFPPASSGLLVSGGSMANLVALTVARNAKAGFDVRRVGLQGCSAPLIYYTSVEAHSSIQKAVESLGLGSDNLRLIPVDDAYRIDLGALEAAITQDRAAGLQPACIIGNAGTVEQRCRRRPASTGRPRPAAKASGSTSTARSAPWPQSRRTSLRSCTAWSRPTPWRWISTSGCTCSLRQAACWYGTKICTAAPSP